VEVATPRGPAAVAGIRGGDRPVQAGMRRIHIGGDVIVAIDGQKVAGQLDVNVVLNRKRPGDTVNVTVYRAARRWTSPSNSASAPATEAGHLQGTRRGGWPLRLIHRHSRIELSAQFSAFLLAQRKPSLRQYREHVSSSCCISLCFASITPASASLGT